MEKRIAVLMLLCLLCGAAMAEASPRILIIYVSRAGENYNVGVTDLDSASAAYAGYGWTAISNSQTIIQHKINTATLQFM